MIEHLNRTLVMDGGHPPPIPRPWDDEEEDEGGDNE